MTQTEHCGSKNLFYEILKCKPEDVKGRSRLNLADRRMLKYCQLEYNDLQCTFCFHDISISKPPRTSKLEK